MADLEVAVDTAVVGGFLGLGGLSRPKVALCARKAWAVRVGSAEGWAAC